MKVHMEIRGWVLDYEKKPMDKERFDTLCGIVFALIAAGTFLKFVSFMA